MKKPYLMLSAVLVVGMAASRPLAAGTELDPLRTIAIQDGGRLKPLDTFARETARKIGGGRAFGAETIQGLEPLEWLLSSLASPDRWRAEPIVRVTHAGLREAVQLPPGKDRFSFNELVRHAPFLKAAEAVHEKLRQDPEAKLDPIEREIAGLYDNLALLSAVFSGEALRIVPLPDRKVAWLSLADLDKSGGQERITILVQALVGAYQQGDRPALRSSAAALQNSLAAVAPEAYPQARDLRLEVRYNSLKPFRLAWMIYLVAFLTLLASLPLASRGLGLTGTAVALAAFLLHGYGMGLRTFVSGRPPVTNMYESVIFVAWGAVLFALIFEAAYKARYFAACASGLAVIALILADSVPILDGSIAPLVPVLRDNFWLTTHVLTITLGYAAFFLAMGIAHLNLGLFFFAPERTALFRALSLFLYRALQVGTLFLAAGTMLGGVWASYSWGRFWGWDPKETWALIALLGYLAVLHGRFIGWFRDFGMAVGAIVGFLGVLMAWYGVNFILGTGLHSYGFGSGGYTYVGAFVGFELLVIAAASLRQRAQGAPSSPAGEPSGRLATRQATGSASPAAATR
jgi:cytochrome c-type biogenesis protein CcsB